MIPGFLRFTAADSVLQALSEAEDVQNLLPLWFLSHLITISSRYRESLISLAPNLYEPSSSSAVSWRSPPPSGLPKLGQWIKTARDEGNKD